MKPWIAAGLFSILITSAYADESAQHWSYEGDSGPAHWGTLHPDYHLCNQGKAQSPINIIEPLTPSKAIAAIHYEPLPLDIINDGETTLTLGNKKIPVNTGHGIQVNNQLDAAHESLTYQGTTYHLVQFHFHVPAEDQWNGFRYPMEIHFVNESDDGKIAVIGVFVANGGYSRALQTIIDNLPKEKNKEKEDAAISLNVKSLLPLHMALASFQGSLTTPPCAEGLQWLMFQHPIVAGSLQIQAIEKAMGHTNARPLQPLNHRQIISANASLG